MSEDAKLAELRERKSKLVEETNKVDLQIRNRKIEVAWENGEIVRSPDKLSCNSHPGAEFVVIGNVGEGGVNASKIYACSGCQEHHTFSQKAYDCPTCGGIVKGEPKREHYNNIGFMSGSSGDYHRCTICDTVVGETIEMRS